jgi:ribose transport system substrate-binding protein
MRAHARTVGRVAVALALAAALAGCAQAQGGEREPGGGRPSVAFVVPSTELNFAKEMGDGFRFAVTQVGGVDFTVAGPPRNDNPGQAKIFQDIVRGGKANDGISLFMQAADLFAPLVSEAHAKKIPMIAVDNQMDRTAKVDLLIGNDNYELGRTVADQVIRKLPADASGEVVIGTPVPGVPVLEHRVKGMRDAFRERLPKVQVLGPFDSKTDPMVNLSTWKGLVAAHPKALAFLGPGNSDGFNLASIRKSSKASWLVGGFDLDPRSLRAVKEGNLLLVSPEHFVKGAIAGRLQAQHAKDGTALPKGWLYTPGLVIDQSNIDDITKRQGSQAAKEAWFAPRIDEFFRDQQKYLRPLGEVR